MKTTTSSTSSTPAQDSDPLRAALAAAQQASPLVGKSSLRSSTGGVSLFSPAVKLGREVAHVLDPEGICGGKVGNSDKICILEKGTCDVESHKRARHPSLPSSAFLVQIMGADRSKGYLPTSLDSYKLSFQVIEDLMETMDADWTAKFEEMKEVQYREDVLKVDKLLKTCTKKKPGSIKDAYWSSMKDSESNDKDVEALDVGELAAKLAEVIALAKKEDTSHPVSLVLPSDLKEENVDKFVEEVFEQLRVLINLVQYLVNENKTKVKNLPGHIFSLEELVDGLKLEMQKVKAVLGKASNSDSETPPQLWAAVEKGLRSIQDLQSSLGEVEQTSDTLQKSVTLLLNHYTSLMQGAAGGSPEGGHAGAGLSHVACNDPTGSNPFEGNSSCSSRCCKFCDMSFTNVTADLDAHDVRIRELEAASETSDDAQTVAVKGNLIKQRADVQALIQKWFGTERVPLGCFVTPHLMWNLVFAHLMNHINGMVLPINDTNLNRMAIVKADAEAFYSLKTARPELFTSTEYIPSHGYKAKAEVRRHSLFKVIPSAKDFGVLSDHNGIQYKIRKAVEDVKTEKKLFIEAQLQSRSNLDPFHLAIEMLNDTVDHISYCLTFMEESHRKCTIAFGESENAWKLPCRGIEEIYTQHFGTALSLVTARDFTQMAAVDMGVFYSSVSLHSMVKDLNKLGIKNHPSIASAQINFLMESVNKVSGNETAMNDLKSEVDSLRSLVTAQARTIDTLSRKHGSLTERVTSAEKKLKKRNNSNGGGNADDGEG
ncbi:predicted protein [Chaetoceros tenuissimus]|uniref:Uncharacterized protein n=1 Tax=Chaetoceros tenuissimus TaxID=426638 RepID=A0AAD3CTK1_9STRA|nr:predicted protein [Chaetoceros tenuissimus]